MSNGRETKGDGRRRTFAGGGRIAVNLYGRYGVPCVCVCVCARACAHIKTCGLLALVLLSCLLFPLLIFGAVLVIVTRDPFVLAQR